jgi:hypothetical protein
MHNSATIVGRNYFFLSQNHISHSFFAAMLTGLKFQVRRN